MGRDEVRRRTFGLFGLLLSRTRAYTIIALFFAFTAFTHFLYSRDHRSFTQCFWHFSQICLHPQISVDERLAGRGEGVKAKNTDYCRVYARVRISGNSGVTVVKPADQGEARGLLF